MSIQEKNLLNKLKTNEEFKNEALAFLFNMPDPSWIIRWNKTNELFLRNERIPNEQAVNLQNEIKLLESTQLWKILTNTLQQDAMERMFFNSKDFDDMRGGKMLLFALSIQQGVINRIKGLRTQQKIDTVSKKP